MSSTVLRAAVVGTGAFGRNHLRILKSLPGVRLSAVHDSNSTAASAAAAEFACTPVPSLDALREHADFAVVATPTITHAAIACELLESGLDVLVEKPIAATVEEAERIAATAARHGRVLQVGHLERFNPAVTVLEKLVRLPLFFEVHRLSIFTPRSLDVDVVLDLMIHDLEIILALTNAEPEEIRAAGISILSPKVDIANVRLAFPGGCVANITASRVSTEKVRKMRIFQPSEYLAVDYSKQDLLAIAVSPERQIQFKPAPVAKDEPLKLELEHFIDCIRTRQQPRVSGIEAVRALRVARDIMRHIDEHAAVVRGTLDANTSLLNAIPSNPTR